MLLGSSPAALVFEVTQDGKPHLAAGNGTSTLHFNLSHSAGLGLVGWSRECEIGVDIEQWRPMHDEAALVRRFFSPAENAAYEALPAAQRTAGFFNAWTRKEAYVKAVGRGLRLPLDSFDVSLGNGPESLLLRSSAHCDDGRVWSMAAPMHLPAVSLAVAVQCENLCIAPMCEIHDTQHG